MWPGLCISDVSVCFLAHWFDMAGSEGGGRGRGIGEEREKGPINKIILTVSSTLACGSTLTARNSFTCFVCRKERNVYKI